MVGTNGADSSTEKSESFSFLSVLATRDDLITSLFSTNDIPLPGVAHIETIVGGSKKAAPNKVSTSSDVSDRLFSLLLVLLPFLTLHEDWVSMGTFTIKIGSTVSLALSRLDIRSLMSDSFSSSSSISESEVSMESVDDVLDFKGFPINLNFFSSSSQNSSSIKSSSSHSARRLLSDASISSEMCRVIKILFVASVPWSSLIFLPPRIIEPRRSKSKIV
mmetsp:Transcript_10797/g.22585  ORF Transcript_10797/g.22585 Transcript_10797/m.22585 type:complete len:219 (-) Transcript_10797:616-1272(-)